MHSNRSIKYPNAASEAVFLGIIDLIGRINKLYQDFLILFMQEPESKEMFRSNLIQFECVGPQQNLSCIIYVPIIGSWQYIR